MAIRTRITITLAKPAPQNEGRAFFCRFLRLTIRIMSRSGGWQARQIRWQLATRFRS